eukprot:Selendium_serpulae@DN5457_c0_g2_i1.p1
MEGRIQVKSYSNLGEEKSSQVSQSVRHVGPRTSVHATVLFVFTLSKTTTGVDHFTNRLSGRSNHFLSLHPVVRQPTNQSVNEWERFRARSQMRGGMIRTKRRIEFETSTKREGKRSAETRSSNARWRKKETVTGQSEKQKQKKVECQL